MEFVSCQLVPQTPDPENRAIACNQQEGILTAPIRGRDLVFHRDKHAIAPARTTDARLR